MKKLDESTVFVFAILGRRLPKRSSSDLWTDLQKRLRNLFIWQSAISNVDSALAKATKLSVTVTRSFNFSDGTPLDPRKRTEIKQIFQHFFQLGHKIARNESDSNKRRRKKLLIRALISNSVKRLNNLLREVDGCWLEGYGNIQNEGKKPGLFTDKAFIQLFNDIVKYKLILYDGSKKAALAIKSVFGNRNTYCSFKLSDEN